MDRWIQDDRFKHTKAFYGKPDKNKAKGVMIMSTLNLSYWIKAITGHNNLAYFQSKLNIQIDPKM